MNGLTYKPGDGLNQLEAATTSAPYQDWELAHRVNVLAPYFLTAGLTSSLGTAAAKGEGRGCVIMFSSPASVHNNQFVPVYQTTKAAVDHLVRIMAAEFADFYSKYHPQKARMLFADAEASSRECHLTWYSAISNDTRWPDIESSPGSRGASRQGWQRRGYGWNRLVVTE